LKSTKGHVLKTTAMYQWPGQTQKKIELVCRGEGWLACLFTFFLQKKTLVEQWGTHFLLWLSMICKKCNSDIYRLTISFILFFMFIDFYCAFIGWKTKMHFLKDEYWFLKLDKNITLRINKLYFCHVLAMILLLCLLFWCTLKYVE